MHIILEKFRKASEFVEVENGALLLKIAIGILQRQHTVVVVHARGSFMHLRETTVLSRRPQSKVRGSSREHGIVGAQEVGNFEVVQDHVEGGESEELAENSKNLLVVWITDNFSNRPQSVLGIGRLDIGRVLGGFFRPRGAFGGLLRYRGAFGGFFGPSGNFGRHLAGFQRRFCRGMLGGAAGRTSRRTALVGRKRGRFRGRVRSGTRRGMTGRVRGRMRGRSDGGFRGRPGRRWNYRGGIRRGVVVVALVVPVRILMVPVTAVWIRDMDRMRGRVRGRVRGRMRSREITKANATIGAAVAVVVGVGVWDLVRLLLGPVSVMGIVMY